MLGLGNSVSSEKIFQPHDISDCVLALYAPYGVDESASGTVISWQSQARENYPPPLGLFAYQSASGKRPAYNNSHITFDGSNDRFYLTQADLSTAVELTLDTSDGGWTVFSIYTSTDWDGSNQALIGDPDDSNNYIRHKTGQQKFDVVVNNTSYTLALDTPSALTDDRYVAIMFTCADDGTITMYIDNVAQADTETISDTTDNFKVEMISSKAGAQHLGGSIKSLVVYDRAITHAESVLLQNWAKQYIG